MNYIYIISIFRKYSEKQEGFGFTFQTVGPDHFLINRNHAGYLESCCSKEYGNFSNFGTPVQILLQGSDDYPKDHRPVGYPKRV